MTHQEGWSPVIMSTWGCSGDTGTSQGENSHAGLLEQRQQPSRWKGTQPGTTSTTAQQTPSQWRGRRLERIGMQAYPDLTNPPGRPDPAQPGATAPDQGCWSRWANAEGCAPTMVLSSGNLCPWKKELQYTKMQIPTYAYSTPMHDEHWMKKWTMIRHKEDI